MLKFKDIIYAIISIASILTIITVSYIYLNKYRNEAERYRNNYFSEVNETKIWKDKYGRTIATVSELRLTNKEIKKSSDSIIRMLYDNNKKLGNKLKNTEAMLAAQITTSGSGTTTVDTIIINNIPSEVDTFEDSLLKIVRIREQNSIFSNYSYTLKPVTLLINISKYKTESWKPINIIFPRDKFYKVDITSDIPCIMFNYVKFVRIKK